MTACPRRRANWAGAATGLLVGLVATPAQADDQLHVILWADAAPVVEEWEEFWVAVHLADLEQPDEPSSEDQSEPPLVPEGDTAFMRHPGLAPELEPEVQARFIAADIAEELSHKLAILRGIADTAAPAVAHRALIGMGLAILRDGAPGAAERLAPILAEAAGLVPEDGLAAADRYLLEAAAQAERGQWRAARDWIARAIAADPIFVSAHVLNIRILSRTLEGYWRRSETADCLADIQGLVASIREIARLTGTERGAFTYNAIAEELERTEGLRSPAIALAVGYAYRRAGDLPRFERALDRIRSGNGQSRLPPLCRSLLGEEAGRLADPDSG